MKVFNIVEEGIFGGPQKRIADVASNLKERGIQTTVLLPDNEVSQPYKAFLEEQGIDHLSIPLHRLTRDKSHFVKYVFTSFFEVYNLVKILRKHRPDIVHCNGSWQIKGIIASRLCGIKNVWHLNDTFMPLVIQLLFKFVAYFFADSFIVACERTKNFYLDNNYFLAKKPVFVVQAPVNTQHFNPDRYVATEDNITSHPGHKVLTVSNVNHSKGLETFIRMVYYVNKNFKGKVNFFVVGAIRKSQQKYYEHLLRVAKSLDLENIYFNGPSREVRKVLNSADVYVCSSDFEASPISVWEALSMKKAIAATDVGDVKTFFEKYQCGLISDVKDSAGLGKNVVDLLNDVAKREALESKAREVAVTIFDIKICADRHANTYQTITGIRMSQKEYATP